MSSRKEKIEQILKELGYRQDSPPEIPYQPFRKLKVTWTPDLAQDLEYYHALEKKMTKKMANEIQKEVDKEILDTLMSAKNAKII